MIISQPAMICLEATWDRLTNRVSDDPETIDAVGPAAQADQALADSPWRAREAVPTSAATSPASAAASLEQAQDAGAPLTAAERRARAAALRALALSRGRRFDAAEAAFAEAARLDPALDLTRTPAFWRLERAAHEAAINAYLRVGRERDAAVLRARVRSTFRPKPLPPRHRPALAP